MATTKGIGGNKATASTPAPAPAPAPTAAAAKPVTSAPVTSAPVTPPMPPKPVTSAPVTSAPPQAKQRVSLRSVPITPATDSPAPRNIATPSSKNEPKNLPTPRLDDDEELFEEEDADQDDDSVDDALDDMPDDDETSDAAGESAEDETGEEEEDETPETSVSTDADPAQINAEQFSGALRKMILEYAGNRPGGVPVAELTSQQINAEAMQRASEMAGKLTPRMKTLDAIMAGKIDLLAILAQIQQEQAAKLKQQREGNKASIHWLVALHEAMGDGQETLRIMIERLGGVVKSHKSSSGAPSRRGRPKKDETSSRNPWPRYAPKIVELFDKHGMDVILVDTAHKMGYKGKEKGHNNFHALALQEDGTFRVVEYNGPDDDYAYIITDQVWTDSPVSYVHNVEGGERPSYSDDQMYNILMVTRGGGTDAEIVLIPGVNDDEYKKDKPICKIDAVLNHLRLSN